MPESVIKGQHYYSSDTVDGASELGYRGTNTPGAYGKSNADSLKTIFKAAPIVGYSPAVTDGAKVDMTSAAALKQWFFDNVVNGTVNDGSFGFGSTFSLDYAPAPDISLKSDHDKAGNLGLANPFVPNPVVDGLSEAPKEFVNKLKPNNAFSPSVLGTDLRNPSKTSVLNKAVPPIKAP